MRFFKAILWMNLNSAGIEGRVGGTQVKPLFMFREGDEHVEL
jgi:hypothetical protein